MSFKKIVSCFLIMSSAFVSAAETATPVAPDTKTSLLAINPSETNANNVGKKIDNQEIKLKLTTHIPQIKINGIKQSAVPNLYQIDTNMGIIYLTHDGNYFVEGELYTFTNSSIKNLTEAEMDKKRQSVLAQQNPNDMIIFAPPKDKIKATLTVFTDIDCGYCRKLHSEIKQTNELGIEVRYIALPRAGLTSESYTKFVSVWCSDNQQEALTIAKQGKEIPAKTCNNPIAKQYELGQSLGINGTPAIIMSDGTLLPGYMPSKQLAQELGILKVPNILEKPAAR